MASAARLPGDYRVGDAVFYTGASETHPNGAQLTYGGDGEIVGPATSETHKENGVAVKFSANADVICCYLTQLGRSPPPTKLPGDYRVGDAVFYAASNEKLSNGDRVLYGEEGEIKGPAYLKHHKEGVTEGVAVKFSANAGVVSCYLTTLSRTPPATTLPGGYRVGDTIFYVGTNAKLSNGDRVQYGEEGEIIGPATFDNRVAVKFTANKVMVNCYLTTLSRRPPPITLPGGYHVGDTVFYAAPTGKFPNGDRVVYGEEGEIVGPATSDNCVAVKFTAKSAIYCSPNHLSRTPPPVSVVETEANMAAREQAFRDAEERAEKAASELLASETVETDMKNARGASKKKKNKKKKNQNRQNRSAHEATRAEPTGEEASDVEAKLREAEAVAAHESAEPATAPMIPRPAIIPATLPAPPRLPGAAASPASPPPPRRRSAIKLGVPRRIELASSTVVAASLYRVDGALSTAVAATAGADGGDDDDDDAIEWATSGDGPGRNDASHFAANSGDNDNAGEDKSEETKEAALRDLLLEDEMTCPITLECFVDPVMTPGGITYERKAIIEHILLRGCDPLDPTHVLTEADLQPNIVVRNICARRRAGQI